MLASMILFGCEAPSSGDDAWTKDGDTLTWTKENTSDKVLRAFEGWNNIDVNGGVVVKIEISDSKASKAGILFDYKEEDGKASYYQLGLGTNRYDGAKPEVYLTKVTGMIPSDITESSSGENPTGDNPDATTAYIIGTEDDNVQFPAKFVAFDGLKMTVYVGFEKEGTGDNAKYILKLGQYNENEHEWVSNKHITSKEEGFPKMNGAIEDVDGKLCAYAMLRKATDGVKQSTINKYTKVTTLSTQLAADAE